MFSPPGRSHNQPQPNAPQSSMQRGNNSNVAWRYLAPAGFSGSARQSMLQLCKAQGACAACLLFAFTQPAASTPRTTLWSTLTRVAFCGVCGCFASHGSAMPLASSSAVGAILSVLNGARASWPFVPHAARCLLAKHTPRLCSRPRFAAQAHAAPFAHTRACDPWRVWYIGEGCRCAQ